MMQKRLWTLALHLAVVAGALTSTAASYTTRNFVVNAPTPEIAEQIGHYAEHYRKEKALQWLGYEMPPWRERCPIRVTINPRGSGGATSFGFGNGQVHGQRMQIEGPLDRLLASVLPHEVTHTVFAHHFRQPVPRWADEGGSVLSEDDLERAKHDKLVRDILNNRRAMPLRRLFALTEYPNDVMVLYAQGYSVTNFLVARSSRPAFLNFVAQGLRDGWDVAVQVHYGYKRVEELEAAWLQHLRETKGRPHAEYAAKDTPPQGPTRLTSQTASRAVTRTTVPPAQPLPPEPTCRGQCPEEADWSRPQRPAPPAHAGPSPIKLGAPRYPQPAAPGSVQLGPPMYNPRSLP